MSRTLAALLACLALGCSQSESGGASAPAASTGSTGAGLAGEWTLSIDTPRGVQHPTLSVTSSDNGLSATYVSRQGSTFIEQVSVDGNRFSFPMQLTIPVGTIEVRYAGEIDGDQMHGFVENPRGQVPFSGVRAGTG